MTAQKFSGRREQERRTGRLNMKILPSVKDAAEQKAAEQGRTLSNYIEQLIIKDCKL